MTEPARTKWDYIYYAMIAGTIFFFGMAIVGFVGELLGWWNDVGEALIQLGSAGGALLGGATLVVGSSRSQVEATKDAVEDTRDAVEDTRDAVDETKHAVEDNGDTLERVDEHLSEQTRVLRQIRDRV